MTMKSDALVKWNEMQGYVKGREWSTMKLPRPLILAIQALSLNRGESCSSLIQRAFEASDLAGDFSSAMRCASGVQAADLPGQQTLRLD